MVDNSPNSFFAPIPENAGALAQVANLPVQQTTGDITQAVDPRKVYLAQQNKSLAGLNDIERDFATRSVADNVAKYGEQAYAVDSNIRSSAVGDIATSQIDRSAGQILGDAAVGLVNGALQGTIGLGQAINTLNPLSRVANAVTDGKSDQLVSGALSSLSAGVQSLADRLTSNKTLQAREIKEYKNMLDEAQHEQEYQEAIANGESAISAGTARIAKDAWSALGNVLSDPTSALDSAANTLGSFVGMGWYNLGAKAAAKVAAKATSAITNSVGKGALERLAPSVNQGIENALAGKVTSTVGKQALKNEAKEGALERILTNPMTAVGLQEGGGAGLQTYNEVNSMSDEELTQSSEMYRDLKAKYLDQGMSEPEAEAQAKRDVVNSAVNRSTLLTGAITAPMGKLLDKAWIKNPVSQFVNGSVKKTAREMTEEGAEGLGQLGSNYVAANTYNNNQDMLEGVGTNIGEGMAGAGLGTGLAGSPSMARSALRNTLGRGVDAGAKAINKHYENKLKDTINSNNSNLNNAITAMKQASETTDTKPDYKDPGSVVSKEATIDTLNKINNVAKATLTKEEADSLGTKLNYPLKEGTNKLTLLTNISSDVLRNFSSNTDELGDDDKITMLNQASALKELHDNMFSNQSEEDVLSQIDNPKDKAAIKYSYAAYKKLGSNKKYQRAVANANHFASDLANTTKDINAIYNDSSLTEEEQAKKVNVAVEAYKYLIRNKILKEDQIAGAEKAAEGIKNEDERIFFLKEVQNRKEQYQKLHDLKAQNDAFTKELYEQVHNVKPDEVEFTRGSEIEKGMGEVSNEKLKTIYDDALTNRNSFASLNIKLTRQLMDGDIDSAYQTMLDQRNFIQSQINKLNAWKESKAENIEANKDAKKGDKRVPAKIIQYPTYNPQTRTWEMTVGGMHAGSIELGATMVKEAQILKNQFFALKSMYFPNDKNLTFAETNNSISDDFINNEYNKYLSQHGKDTGFTKAANDVTHTTEAIKPEGNTEPVQQAKAQPKATTQAQPTQNQTVNTNTAPTGSNTQANTVQQSAPAQEAKPTPFNAKAVFDTNKVNKPTENTISSFHEEDGKPNFLSNFYDSPVTYEGRTYKNVESAFQAAKSADDATKDMFTDMTGAEAKKFGRKVKLRSDWETIDNNGVPTKVKVMGNILREKFKDSELRKKLLATGNAPLIEGNTWKDNYWGAVQNQAGEYVGANVLGHLLQQIRNEIRNEVAKSTEVKPTTEAKVETKSEPVQKPVTKVVSEPVQQTSAERLTRARNKLFGFKKDKFKTLQNLRDKLAEIFNDSHNENYKGLTSKDASSLDSALNPNIKNSAINVFSNALTDTILKNSKTKPVHIDFDKDSVLYKKGYITTSNNGYTALSYDNAISALKDESTLSEMSDSEIETLYDNYPSLSLLSFVKDNKGKLVPVVDQDIAANVLLNAISYFNQHKNSRGNSYDRIAESIGMDLTSILTARNSKGEPVGREFLEKVTSGSTSNLLTFTLAKDINRSLGLTFFKGLTNKTKNIYAQDIANAAIASLVNTGAIDYTEFDAETTHVKVFSLARDKKNNIIPSLFNSLEQPEGLDVLLGNTREKDTGAIYVAGSEPNDPSSHNTYEHSNKELPDRVKQARDNCEKIAYKIDEDMTDIYQSLGKEGLVELYGDDVSDAENMDENDLTSKKGRNLEITNAFDQLFKIKNQMTEEAKKAGTTLSNMRKRYKLGITVVGRIQELESYGPIANKLVREGLLATWKTVPIKGKGSKKAKEQLARAIIQNFGGHLNKKDFDKTNKAFQAIVDAIKANPVMFQNLMALNDSKHVTVDTIRNAHKELALFMSNNPECKNAGCVEVDQNYMGLHAMQTLAKYVQALENKDKEFTTSIYCEADGTTNGTINSQFLFTSNLSIDENGDWGEHAIKLMDMGNMRLGDVSGDSAGKIKDNTLAEEKDAYAASGAEAKQAIAVSEQDFASFIRTTPSKTAKDQDGKPIDQDRFIGAIDNLFKLSGQTSDSKTALKEEITRNFMKSPCTKGMYGAGLLSIVKTFVLGGGKVKAIFPDMYEKHTKVMKAVAKAKKNGEKITKEFVAKAMFEGTKGLTEKDYVKALDDYISALNITSQYKLKLSYDKKSEKTYLNLVKVKRTKQTANTFSKGKSGWITPKYITWQSFLSNADRPQNVASLQFDAETTDAIVDAVKEVYGRPIFQAIKKTIRADNIAPTQNVMQNTSVLATTVNNIVNLGALSNLDKNSSVEYANQVLGSSADTESSDNNVISMKDNLIEIAYEEKKTSNELAGGSVHNAHDFAQYERTSTLSNTDYGYGLTSAPTYTYLESPGIKMLANATICLGDAAMMNSAMIDLLPKIDYRTSLIFDGGNAAVGDMDVYGKTINEIQYKTDLSNPIEAFLDKSNDIVNTVTSDTDNTVIEQGYEIVAKAVNLEPGVLTDAGINIVINLSNTVTNSDPEVRYARDKAIKDWCKEKNAPFYKTASLEDKQYKTKDVLTPDLFNSLTVSAYALRKAAKEYAYKRFEQIAPDIINTLLPAAKAAHELTPVATELVSKGILGLQTIDGKQETPSAALARIYRNELAEMLSFFTGHFSDGMYYRETEKITAAGVKDLAVEAAKAQLEDIKETSHNISVIQTAKYLMGGTYDHMASHDAPYVSKPTKKEFKDILAKFHLVPKKGFTVDSIWNQAMKADKSPNAELTKLHLDHPDTNDFLKQTRKRADILRGFTNVISACTEYKPEYTNKPVSVNPKSYAKNIHTGSVKNFLNNTKNGVANRLAHFFDAFNGRGMGKNTKILTFTGSTRQEAIEALRAKYNDDIDQANMRIIESNSSDKLADKQLSLRNTDAVDAELDRISKDDSLGMQYYDETTDTVYILPVNPSGIMSKAQEDITNGARVPHEVFHALTVKALGYYGKLFDQGFTSSDFTKKANRTRNPNNKLRHQRTALAMRAYERLNSLKAQVDAVIPTDVDSIPEEFFQLRSYAQHVANSDMSESAKMKEFIAYFGTMTDAEISDLTSKLAQANATGSIRDIAQNTYKDALTLKNLIYAVRSAFAKFISHLFGWRPESATVQKIIHANMAILNSVTTEDTNNKDGNTLDFSLNTEADEVNFLKETEDPNDDTRGSENDGAFEFNTEPRTSKQATLTDLSNSLIRAVKKAFSIRTVKDSANRREAVERELRKNTDFELFKERLNNDDPNKFSILKDVITPLENLGLNVGDKKVFANVVNALSYLKGVKAPFYGDVSEAVKQVLDKLHAEDFCTDVKDQAQLDKGNNIVKFLQGIDEGSLSSDLIIPVVFALSQTDGSFKKILSGMKRTNTKNIDDYLYFDKLFNSFANKALEVINTLRDITPSKNQQEQLSQLLVRMANDEADFSKTNFLQKAIDKVDGLIDNSVTKLAMSVAKKFGIQTKEQLAKLPEFFENGMNNSKWVPHFVTEFMHDIIGATPDSYDFYAIERKAKVAVQQTRQNALEQAPLAIKEKFNKQPTNAQWKRFTKTIGRSGIATLYSSANPNELHSLLTNNSKVDEEINTLKNQIQDSYRINKCKQLATYMLTGKAGKMLIRNPLSIARGLGSGKVIEPSKQFIDACDKLASLYALKMLSNSERNELASLLKSEPDGMKMLLNTARNQYEVGMNKALGSRKGENNWYKASVTSSYETPHNFKVAPMTNRKDMERMGYKYIKPYTGSNLDRTKLGIFYTDFNHANPFNPGALQFTGTTANGINLVSGSSLKPNGGLITDFKEVQYIIQHMDKYASANDEELLPVFSPSGNIIAFERTLDPKLLENNKYLSPREDYSQLLGIQEGRNVEESMVTEFNHKTVDILVDKYEKANSADKRAYVDLFSITNDPVITNVLNMIPRELRDYMRAASGSDQFMVLRSEINDIIGYHSASITDSWTGESRIPKPVQDAIVSTCETVLGKNAFKYLKMTENGVHMAVNTAKNNIIIRTMAVPAMNLAANVLQLAIEGVPLHTIVTYIPRVVKELNQYTKLNSELLRVKQELAGETLGYRQHQLEAQKKVLLEAIDNLSIAPLLKAKEFSSIADLGNNSRDLDLTNGSIGDKIIAAADKLSDNQLYRSIVHYGAIAPDTSLYKLLEKTNQYGDFLGKAVLYKDLTERKNWSSKDALNRISEEFVDYQRLPGRGRDFLERNGLLWFYNFKLRMMKIAFRNLKEHPLLTLALSAGGLPTPLSDSLLGKAGVLGYTIGPGLLVSSFSSMPFFALLGLLF